MTERVADKYSTAGVGFVDQFVLLEEERQPLPDDPSPAMLVTRVNERLVQAAFALIDEQEIETEEILQAGVYFLGAAGFAVTAIAHMHAEDGENIAECKDRLLERLDDDVAEHLEGSEEFYDDATAGKLLKCCLSLMVGACQSVAELEGMNALRTDEDDSAPLTVDDVLDGTGPDLAEAAAEDADQVIEDEWREGLLDQIAESLWQTAVASVGAAHWLLALDEPS